VKGVRVFSKKRVLKKIVGPVEGGNNMSVENINTMIIQILFG
jgi:hypothetical protein